MESAFGRYLSSPLFTFTVGADKKQITVHSSAFAGLSRSLNALMNGEMMEAKTRHVDWSEVDVDTFARLCEFAYCRDYTPPSFRLVAGKFPRFNLGSYDAIPEPEPELEPIPEPEPEPIPAFRYRYASLPSKYPPSDPFSNDDPEMPYKERSVWTKQLHNAFEGSLVVSSQSEDLGDTFTPPKNTGSWEDFTPVFLEQARLYVLADKYGIEPLSQLVLSKLYQTLKSFKLYDTGVSGIVELVRFVYLNTPPSYDSKLDALRNLVTCYVVSILGQIGENESFQELLEEGGSFVSDFWRIIWRVDQPSSRLK
ncbi:hypothetical protein PEX1_012130 [Penicillium expansum]|nr:hypothetical protein PEX1_012130 [Penicillium expansum]